AVSGRIAEVQDIVFKVARSASTEFSPDFTAIPQRWRNVVFDSMNAAELAVTRDEFDNAAATSDRLLESQVAGLISGGSAAFVRRVEMDRVLQTARQRLRDATSTTALLAGQRQD